MFKTFSNKKYRGKIAIVVLSGYLLISVLSVFHYHKFDLLQNPEIKPHHSNTSSGFSKIGSSQFVCTIQLNYSHLHSVNISDLAISTFHIRFEDIDFIPVNNFKLLSEFFISSKLRAPPTV